MARADLIRTGSDRYSPQWTAQDRCTNIITWTKHTESLKLVVSAYFALFTPLGSNDVIIQVEIFFSRKMDVIFEYPVKKYALVTSFRLSICLVPKL